MSHQQPISTFLGIAAAVVLVSSSYAVIINVPGDEPTIQAGINAAVNGDVVIVAQGEYFENINFNGKAITVRSTDPNDAGVVLNTIINGGGVGTVVTCDSGEGSDTVLSGFVITGGNAPEGGGMQNIGSSPTVTNCSFIGNTATGLAAQGATLGGGMFNSLNSNPTVSKCTFSGNTAGNSGGGMHNGPNSSPTVTNCTFSGNTSGGSGGGMTIAVNGSPTVTNCTFSGNTAANDGGGMFNSISSSPTVTNCTFSGNTAASNGGGMYNSGNSSPTVSNTGFCNNTPDAVDGDPINDGGGNSLLYCPPPIPTPDPCPADFDGDGVVSTTDLLELLDNWGPCP